LVWYEPLPGDAAVGRKVRHPSTGAIIGRFPAIQPCQLTLLRWNRLTLAYRFPEL
jgi:hypothetical protein